MAAAPAPPDPAELERLAYRLEQAALAFEEIGSRQSNRSQGLRWTGGAALKFVQQMQGFSHGTSQAAGALRELAGGLRSGAAALRNPPKAE
jgi:uncharacterized protein YukE